MKKRFIIGILLLVLLSTYKPEKLVLETKFNIKEIIIENNYILEDREIKKNLVKLYGKNLFFLNIDNIKDDLIKLEFIESYEVRKIYPNKLRIKIFEKNPIAILEYKKEKFFYTKKGELIDYKDLENFKNLPIVDGNRENFKILYNNLKKINFSIKQIKKFYYFESNRWDLLTLKDKTVKLPINNYTKSLENFSNLINDNNFDKYTIFDYRIDNQLILK